MTDRTAQPATARGLIAAGVKKMTTNPTPTEPLTPDQIRDGLRPVGEHQSEGI